MLVDTSRICLDCAWKVTCEIAIRLPLFYPAAAEHRRHKQSRARCVRWDTSRDAFHAVIESRGRRAQPSRARQPRAGFHRAPGRRLRPHGRRAPPRCERRLRRRRLRRRLLRRRRRRGRRRRARAHRGRQGRRGRQATHARRPIPRRARRGVPRQAHVTQGDGGSLGRSRGPRRRRRLGRRRRRGRRGR